MEPRPPVVGASNPDQALDEQPRPNVVLLVALGLVAGLIGILIGLTARDGASDPSGVIPGPASSATTTTQPSDNQTTSATSTTPSPTVTTAVTTVSVAPPTSIAVSPATQPEVLPLAGAGFLEGSVALTPFPEAGGGNTLWVFRPGGSVVRRDDLPFYPGFFSHPMLFTGGRIVFSDGGYSFILDADLVEPPVRLRTTGLVVPGARPGLVWLVDPLIPIGWVAPLDVDTQTVGERFEVGDVIQWPLTGIADGLVVIPVDEDTNGTTAYWSPDEGLRPIELITPSQSGVHTAADDIAVVVSPGVIRILDFTDGEFVSSFPIDLGQGNVSEVCLSPDQRYVAIVGSTGEAFVADTRSGAVLHRFSGLHDRDSIGWTSNEQLVYIADIAGETWIEVLDVSTGDSAEMALLRGSREWWLTASGTMC